MRSLTLVLDFDGTITQKDIGDEVCDRFAPPAWRDIDADWVAGKLSLPEAQRRMWALARGARPEVDNYAREIGMLREGLDEFLDAAQGAGAKLWLASGGFDFYIEALLGPRISRFERAYFNRAEFSEDGRIAVSFPHADLGCARCAVCKGKVCDLARQAGAERVVFIGDGASDRCAIGRADEVAAIRGQLLDRTLDDRGIAHVSFTAFSEIAALVSRGS